MKALLASVPPAAGRLLRYYGLSEAEVAATLRALEQERDLSGVEVTTCLRRSELEVDLRPQPGAEDAAAVARRGAGRPARGPPDQRGRHEHGRAAGPGAAGRGA